MRVGNDHLGGGLIFKGLSCLDGKKQKKEL